jgi:endogenous inhibitor of DNA gyrase (YacG/DUF329 family)
MPTVACPTCGKPVPWDASAPWRPFCSERCKLIDLGEWMSEGHRIPGEPASDERTKDSDEADVPQPPGDDEER